MKPYKYSPRKFHERLRQLQAAVLDDSTVPARPSKEARRLHRRLQKRLAEPDYFTFGLVAVVLLLACAMLDYVFL